MPDKKEYTFILVEIEKISDLQKVIETMQPYNLQYYGIVVDKGIAPPPQMVIDMIKRDYNYEFTV